MTVAQKGAGPTSPKRPGPDDRRAMDLTVDQMARIAIDCIGRFDQLEALQAHLDDHPGPDCQLRLRALLVGLVMNAGLKRDNHLTQVARLLRALPNSLRHDLEVEVGGHVVTYRQVWHCWHRLRQALDQLAPVVFDGSAPHGDAVSWFTDRLLDATTPADIALSDCYSVDGTDVETWARVETGANADGERTRSTLDDDAREGHSPAKNGRRGGTYFGYEDHLLVQTRNMGGPEVPLLIRRHRVTSAGTHRGQTAVDLVRETLGDGIAVEHLIADRGYSISVVDKFAAPLEAMGVDRTHDLMSWQRDPQPDVRGFLVLDGGQFCPGTPKDLWDLPPVKPGMRQSERDALVARYDERANYAATLQQGRSTGDGHIRVACPAQRGGHSRCELVPPSLRRPISNPTVAPPPQAAEAPRPCCNQVTVQIPATAGLRDRQKYLYGTSTWVESKNRRVGVESANATVKVHYGRVGRNYIRSLGLVNYNLLLTFTHVAANLLTLVAYRAKHGLPDPHGLIPHPKTRRPRAKRRTGGLSEILPKAD